MSKVVLITGSSSGFGRDTAETLAKDGHRVFASMRDPDGRNRAHADALRSQGISVVELDVTNDSSVNRGVDTVLGQAGRLDVLVNNAGIGAGGISEGFSTEQVRQLLDVNVLGVHRTLRAVLPSFRKRGEGLIINLGSVLGRVTLPFFGTYGATKFALEALIEGYRYDLSQLGIDVVLLQPSAYPTSIFATALMPADQERVAAYGEVAAMGGQLMQAFEGQFKSAGAPNPHEVAEAIRNLVQLPSGSRPDRVIVGAPFGADILNAQSAAVQAQGLAGFGLSVLGKTKRPVTVG